MNSCFYNSWYLKPWLFNPWRKICYQLNGGRLVQVTQVNLNYTSNLIVQNEWWWGAIEGVPMYYFNQYVLYSCFELEGKKVFV